MAPGSLGARLFVALLVATLVASALVVRARTPDLMLEVRDRTQRFTPDGDGRLDTARIEFFVRESDPRATVQLVGPELEVVRTFAAGEPLEADRRRTLVWDGRTDAGDRAPEGRYRLRVILPGADRDMVFPRRIDLDR